MKKSVAFFLILVMIIITAFMLIFINKNSDAPLDDYPPCVYIQDNVYITSGNAVTTLPSDVILLGEIKKTVSRSEPLPEKNFTSNVFPIGTKIYGSKTDSTLVYVQLETTGEDKYSIYKTTE